MAAQQTAFCAAILLNPSACNHPSLLNFFTGQHIHSHVLDNSKASRFSLSLSPWNGSCLNYTHRHRKDDVLMYMWLQAEVDQNSRPSLSVEVMISNLFTTTPLLLLSSFYITLTSCYMMSWRTISY